MQLTHLKETLDKVLALTGKCPPDLPLDLAEKVDKLTSDLEDYRQAVIAERILIMEQTVLFLDGKHPETEKTLLDEINKLKSM